MGERPGRPRELKIIVGLEDAPTRHVGDGAIDEMGSGLLQECQDVDRHAGNQQASDRGTPLCFRAQAHCDSAVQDQELKGADQRVDRRVAETSVHVERVEEAEH